MYDVHTTVDNLYVIKNNNGTVDTISGPIESVGDLVEAAGFVHGGTVEMMKISSLEDLDLQSHMLTFDFVQSMN